jgi:L-ribulose-5-phosphate 3-epimerase UlaE
MWTFCFVLFFLLYSHIVNAKYSRLLYWHALYLGQAETQYLSLIRSFHEHIVAFHLIKTYALIIERSHKNVIGLIFGQGALDGQIYTLKTICSWNDRIRERYWVSAWPKYRACQYNNLLYLAFTICEYKRKNKTKQTIVMDLQTKGPT